MLILLSVTQQYPASLLLTRYLPLLESHRKIAIYCPLLNISLLSLLSILVSTSLTALSMPPVLPSERELRQKLLCLICCPVFQERRSKRHTIGGDISDPKKKRIEEASDSPRRKVSYALAFLLKVKTALSTKISDMGNINAIIYI